MRGFHGMAGSLCAALLALSSLPAFGDDMTVNITNDSTDAIVLTVYDTSGHQRTVILSQRINGFSTVPVNIPQSAHGEANLAWTAVTVDASNRKCGRGDGFGLEAKSSVTVHADAECAPLNARAEADST
jgi:hypothetical protein